MVHFEHRKGMHTPTLHTESVFFFRLLIGLCLFLSFLHTSPAQNKTDLLLNNGRNALFFDDYVLAIHYFNRFISLRPSQSLPYYYRAVAKIQLEDFTGAITDCDSALIRNPFMPDAWMARGYAHLKTGKPDDAENDLNKALTYAPDNASIILYRIEALKNQKKYEAALSDIQRLLHRKRPPHANLLHAERAQIHLAMGDTTAADLSLDSAIYHDPAYADFYAIKAYIYLLRNENTRALDYLNRAIALGADYPSVYINRGVLLHQSFRYLDAMTDYSRAIELDPDQRQARFNRALLRSEVGDLNHALEDLNQLLDDAPTSSLYDEARFQRGVVCLQLHDFHTARSDFAILIAQYPDFTPAYYGHADACQALGQTHQAAVDRYKAMLIESKPVSVRKQLRAKGTPATIAAHSSLSALTNTWNGNDSHEKWTDKIRGNVQEKRYSFTPRKPFFISYYATASRIESENNVRIPKQAIHPLLQFNNATSSNLSIANSETPLSEELIDFHLQCIKNRSTSTQRTSKDLFLRAVHHHTLLNHHAAVCDLDTAINRTTNTGDSLLLSLLYFERGSIRLQLLVSDASHPYGSLIINDLQQSLNFYPGFAPAWYNLGCLFLSKKENQKAEEAFSNALESDPDMAEGWFNRAIARLRLYDSTGNTLYLQQVRNDLSQAGEKGIYQSYSILKQLTATSKTE